MNNSDKSSNRTDLYKIRTLPDADKTQINNKNKIAHFKARKSTKLKEKHRHYIDDGDFIRYFSAGDKVNLNCTIPAFKQQNTRIGDRKITIADTVKCRHLALAFAKRKGTAARFHGKTNNEDKIAAYPDFKTDLYEGSFSKKALVAKKGYFFTKDDFPKLISRLISENWGKQNYEKRFILSTGTHTMAVTISNKENGEYSKITFYDPNDTIRHHNTLVYNPNVGNKLTLETISQNSNIAHHFSKFQGVATLETTELVPEDQCETHIISDITSSLVRMLARRGHFQQANLGKELNNKYQHEPDKLFQLYGGTQSKLIFEVMNKNNLQNVSYITKSILDSSMTPEQKIEILAGECGLHKGFKHNFHEGVEAFCEQLLADNRLSAEEKYEILAQENYSAQNGLYIAFTENNPEVIKAFTKAILTSNLPNEYKKSILTITQQSETKTAINFDLSAPESLAAFINTVTQFASEDLKDKIFATNNIDSSKIAYLYQTIVSGSMEDIEKHLNEKYPDTTITTEQKLAQTINSIITHAKNQENYKNINIFLKTLLANNQLSNVEKEQILMQNDIKKLFITDFITQNSTIPNGAILRIFNDILTNESLSEDNKAKRLLNIAQESAINTLLAIDKTEIIEEITTNLVNSNLDEDKILKQLQPNSNRGSNWLYDALHSDKDLTKFINNFTNSVLQSNLSIEAKTIILTPVDKESELVTCDLLQNTPNTREFINAISENKFFDNLKNYSENKAALNLAVNYALQFGNDKYLARLINSVNNSFLVQREKISTLVVTEATIDKALERDDDIVITTYLGEILHNKKVALALCKKVDQQQSVIQKLLTIDTEQYSFIDSMNSIKKYKVTLNDLFKFIFYNNYFLEEEKVSLLLDTTKGTSLLYDLLVQKNDQDVQLIIKEILQSTLKIENIAKLLQLKSENKSNLLYTTLNCKDTNNKNTKIMQNITRCIVNDPELSIRNKYRILTPIDQNNRRIALKLFSSSNPNVQILIEAVKVNSIIYNGLYYLYYKPSEKSDLYNAVKYRDFKFIDFYLDEIISRFNSDEIKKILTETNEDKSALDLALEYADNEILALFFNKILNHQPLSDHNKIEILHAHDKNGNTFLYRLLEQQSILISPITKIIADSKLSTQATIKLLQARNNQGASWLYDALNKKDESSLLAVKNYVDSILNNENFSKETKLELLTPINEHDQKVRLKDIIQNEKITTVFLQAFQTSTSADAMEIKDLLYPSDT